MSDYISREVLLSRFNKEHAENWKVNKTVAFHTLYALAAAIPSADVRENIHGELLHDDAGRKVCSNCGSRFFSAERIHFCPFCGCELFCYLVECEDKE